MWDIPILIFAYVLLGALSELLGFKTCSWISNSGPLKYPKLNFKPLRRTEALGLDESPNRFRRSAGMLVKVLSS